MSEHCHSSRCSALHSGSTQNQNFPSSLSCVLTLLEASLVVKASYTEWTTTRCITRFRLTVNFILLSQLSVSLSMVDVSDAVAGRRGWGWGGEDSDSSDPRTEWRLCGWAAVLGIVSDYGLRILGCRRSNFLSRLRYVYTDTCHVVFLRKEISSTI